MQKRIYIGYPCVGKTTWAENLSGVIDLESSLFFANGERYHNWHKVAAKMALNFLKQGFDVFTTSHKDLCDELSYLVKNGTLTTEEVYIIFPSPNLKEQWIEKIKQRYENTKLYTHRKAYENCCENFSEHIENMLSYDCFTQRMITDLDYNLIELINS